jgi:Secretion system C-terminal sorting domain
VSGSSILTNYIVRVMDSISESGGFSLPKRTSYAVNKRWLVYAAGNTATVSFQWNASDELTGFNRSSSYIAMYSFGGFPWGWTSVATTGTNPYIKTRTGIIANYPGGISALGSFGIASNSALLPVELISFTGKKVDKNVQLDWKTSSEINNDHFDVERSVDGSLFKAIGKVKGNGTSDLIHDYQFTDYGVPTISNQPSTVFYRLKQVDLDGKETLSNIIQIHLNDIHTNLNIALSPNPFTKNFELSVDSKSASDLLIQVYDVNGKLVMERTSKIMAGLSNQTISELSEYSPGFYYVRMTINGEVFTNKMVKVN